MRAGFVQTKPEFGKKKENIDRAVAMVENVGADLLVLPELFNTGYFFPSKDDVFKLGEDAQNGKTVRTFKALARKKKCHFVIGIAEVKSGRTYNTSVYITPKGKTYLYRKVHLFYNEPAWFSRGNLKFSVFPFYEYKLGMMICFDYMFPEACRALMLEGANLICHPSNLVLQYCQDAMRTRSLENWVYTITANRIGTDTIGDQSLKFTGLSQVTSINGDVLVRAGKSQPVVKTVDIDLEQTLTKKPTELNELLADRRPSFYTKLCE